MLDDTTEAAGLTAVVVDDDDSIRLLAQRTLEKIGFEVVEAADGAEALERIESCDPAIVLLDVMMPKVDGFEVCSALRENPGFADTPIIMLTGLDDLESINRAYEVGATDFITKPVNWSILQHRARYILRASQAFEDLRVSETSLAEAQRIARLGNWEWDADTGSVTCSDEVYRILGLDPGDGPVTFGRFIPLVHPEDRDHVEETRHEALEQGVSYDLHYRLRREDGSERFIHEQGEPVFGSAEASRSNGLVGTLQDVTERKRFEEQITFMTYHDTLTGLPNRRMFKDRLHQALRRAERYGRPVALLYLNLDRFKRINDVFGHSIGDEVLQDVAERVSQCVRGSDTVARFRVGQTDTTVARLGGDEFIVLLPDVREAQDAAKVARRMLDVLGRPFVRNGSELFITSSIGISLAPGDGADVETLLRNAHTAMYHAKESSRNDFQFYTEEMNSQVQHRLALESQLHKALDKEEFLLHYQPVYDLESGRITSVESLIRWENANFGLVAPDRFIPIAEEVGLIVPIGRWVLETACATCRSWIDEGLDPPRVAVNLSATQVQHGDLVSDVASALNATGLDPRHLELELTETALIAATRRVDSSLNQLKELGVVLAIDDFGTGYSSLSYLKRFPLDRLKIDRSFIQDLPGDAEKASIVSAIIAMSQGLHLEVIAEGVEDDDQVDFLRARGCDAAQGFLFQRPAPVGKIAALLRPGADHRARASGLRPIA